MNGGCTISRKETDGITVKRESYLNNSLMSGWKTTPNRLAKQVPLVKELKSKSEVAQSCPTVCDPMDCSFEEDNGNPRQYSRLENLMDRGAW